MKLDINLLKDLYMIDHPSGSEQKMLSFIINECKSIPNITFELDYHDNLFITKNTNNPDTFACVIAHTDQIVTNKGEYEVCNLDDKILFGSHKLDGSSCGLGCDDSNGICVAIQLLKVLPDLKCVFTTEEELGVRGAQKAVFNTEFLNNIRFFLQADRRGSSDLIVHTNGIKIVTDEFLTDLEPIVNKYGYSKNIGTLTDVGEFVDEVKICGVNISCGYYNEHTVNEYCVISELENCLNFMYEIITTLPDNKRYELQLRDSLDIYDFEYYPESELFLDYSENYLPCDNCIDMDCMNCKHEGIF